MQKLVQEQQLTRPVVIVVVVIMYCNVRVTSHVYNTIQHTTHLS